MDREHGRIAQLRCQTDAQGLAAGAQEEGNGLVDIFNQNIGFGTDVEVRHELRIGVGKGKADRFIGSPQHAMSQTIAIERYRRIKIGDAKHMIVELSKQGAAHAHRQSILPLQRISLALPLRRREDRPCPVRLHDRRLGETWIASPGTGKVAASPRHLPKRTISRTTCL